MKKYLFAFLCISLALFSFVSCDNNASQPGFDGNANDVADALGAVDLIKGVFDDAKIADSGVTVSYSLSAAKKAISEGAYTLTATAAFDGYKASSSVTIESGSLIYAFEGNIDNAGKFTAKSYSVTSKDLRISGTAVGDSDVGMTVTVDKTTANSNVFEAAIPTSANVGAVEPTSVNAAIIVTSKTEIEITVGGKPADPVTGNDTDVSGGNEPAPEPGDEYTAEEIAIDYIKSISKANVANDLIASAKGEESPINVEFTDTPNRESTEIKFTVSLNSGKTYSTGFHDGYYNRAITGGSVDVVVTGSFTEQANPPAESSGQEASIATFNATGYTIKGSGTVKDDKFGTCSISDVDITGDFTAEITLVGFSGDGSAQNPNGGMSFQLDNLEFSLPKTGVSFKINGEQVDWAEVEAVVGPETGTN